MHFFYCFFRIPFFLAVWWTVGRGPEGCTLPWTTLRHAVLFLISWHFCSSCLRLEPYMGIIQQSQRAISLNYICLVVAFTFHCEINCVSMTAPVAYIMACITVLPHLTTSSWTKGGRGRKEKQSPKQCPSFHFFFFFLFAQRLQSADEKTEGNTVKCFTL